MIRLNKRIVVFAPHPDDETLGSGGTITKKISEGYEVIIVVMTDGRNALLENFGVTSDPTPEEMKIIRKAEAMRATAKLGVSNENLLFLDFEDGKLNEFGKEAERRVVEILKTYSPVEIYFPCERDVNVDHQATSLIVKNSVQQVGLSISTYQYSVFQKFARIGPAMDRILCIFRHNLLFVDISRFLHLKEEAIREFKSQIMIMSDKQKKPVIENIAPFLRSKETFYLR